jgi:hypothetical protein
MTAINNLKTSGGNNNFTNGAASGNTGAAGSATGEGSIMGVKPPVVRLLPLTSLACMVIVEVLLPSAATLVRLAVRVERAVVATPGACSRFSNGRRLNNG